MTVQFAPPGPIFSLHIFAKGAGQAIANFGELWVSKLLG